MVYCAYCGSDEIVGVEDHDECMECGRWFSEDDVIIEVEEEYAQEVFDMVAKLNERRDEIDPL